MQTISATDARQNFYDLLEEVAAGKKIAITNKGETRAILISQEEFDSWIATAETLSDPELMEAIRVGDKDMKAGRYRSWDEIKKELGLDVSDKTTKSGRKRSKKTR